ncbi:hypothetical protein EW026_g8135 [Hermanssonia centrifuga]|uniref:Uncharacterized protein n=1 Tax=Hermanssonia centrifuga TaxID=98765 RepID=A0A4S4K5D6_9APHY|nr:hypothetical protein EW026_g8135 [Hermanssonia centrifuga]
MDRLAQLGLHPETPQRTAVERELAAIIVHLTSKPVPDALQLAAQADTIAQLTLQREYLLREKEDATRRFSAERDAWHRTAQALVSQRSAAEYITKEDVVDRQVTRLEDENKALKQKLSLTTHRMSVLESELFHLRPLLVMEDPTPSTSTESFSFPSLSVPPLAHVHANPRAERQAMRRRVRKEVKEREAWKERERDRDSIGTVSGRDEEEIVDGVQGASSFQQVLQSQAQTAQRPSHPYYRTSKEREMDLAHPTPRRTRPPPSSLANTPSSSKLTIPSSSSLFPSMQTASGRASGGRGGGPLMTDARAECILLAARTVGKRRAGIMAGILKEKESVKTEKDEETEKEDSVASTVSGTGRKTSGRNVGTTQDPLTQGPNEAGPSTLASSSSSLPTPSPSRPLKTSSSTPAMSPSHPGGPLAYAALPGVNSVPHVLYVNPMPLTSAGAGASTESDAQEGGE